MVMFKAVGVLILISFIAGTIIGNYVINKGSEFIGGGASQNNPEIKVSTPIDELPSDFILPRVDIGKYDISKSDIVTIIFPSNKYGEIRVKVPIKREKC